MLGLGKNDSEEKMWNFLLFKFYGTDKEFEKAGPFILVAAIIIIALIFIFL